MPPSNYPPNGDMPSPLGTLDDLLEFGDQTATPVKTFIGHNLGFRTFLVCIPMHEFFKMSDVANEAGAAGEPIAQRKLDPAHAQNLAKYILRGLVAAAVNRRLMQKSPVPPALAQIQERIGPQPYLSLQPIVANIRTCKPLGASIPAERLTSQNGETAAFKVMLSQKDILWVVDGQHRRKGMDLVFEFLDTVRSTHKYPKKNSLYPVAEDLSVTPPDLQAWQECFDVARGFSTVAVEIHLGLDYRQERQLFHDLNNLGKKVDRSLALTFDDSNPVNAFVKSELHGQFVNLCEHELKNWDDDKGELPIKDVVAVNAHLFLNKTNISGATPQITESRKPVARRFWLAISAIPGFGEQDAKKRTIAAQPVVLKALAKLTFDFAFGRKQNEEHLNKLLDGITDIDFAHTNPMWRFYELSASEREAAGLSGLAAYLPSDDDGKNRDIGSSQGDFMRFGAKHNDIFPILGDMVRWRLGLPSRSATEE
jgi:hypothetical protein